MDESTARQFLIDLTSFLRTKALDAKMSKDASGGLYEIGALMAYHDMISLIQSQAGAFGISLEEVELSGINPETDLL